MDDKIRVLIADDHMLIRQAFRRLLERVKNIDVLEDEATTGIEAIAKVGELKPDILLLDINMPEMNGLEALKIIKKENSEQKVIILSIHDSKEYISETMKLGANGYISKDADIDLLVDAINSVQSGENYIQPTIFKALFANESTNKNPLDAVINNENKSDLIMELLTTREIEVLKAIVKGQNNKDMSNTLGITEKTVRNHLYNIFKKIDITDRTQAALFGIEHDVESIDTKTL